MGIAYSKRNIFTGQIRTSSLSFFLADIGVAMQSAGWQKIRDITNGSVYQCFSPDGRFSAKLQIAKGSDSFAGPRVFFTPLSANELFHGYNYSIVYGNPTYSVYQVVVGACQFFLSLPLQAISPYSFDQSSNFAFGIPFVPNPGPGTYCALCGVGDPVNDIWWANGDGGTNGFVSETFRNSPRCFTWFNYYVNGLVYNAVNSGDPASGMLTLYYLAPSYNLDSTTGQIANTTKFSTNVPLNLDALVGWNHIVIGQLWDAFQRTQAEPLDAVQNYTDVDSQGGKLNLNFQVWMSSFYSSLLLLQTPIGPGGGNVAY